MSLTDKLQAGKRAFLAGTLAGVLTVSGCSGCRNSNYDSSILDTTTSTEVYQGNKDKKSKNEREYSFEEEFEDEFKNEFNPEKFIRYLGKERLIPGKEKELMEILNEPSKERFIIFCFYQYPEKSYSLLKPEVQKEVDRFELTEENRKLVEQNESILGFRLISKNSKMSRADVMTHIYLEGFKEVDFTPHGLWF